MTFEVTDGTDLNDSEGRVATLTLPITVLPGANRPPTLTPTEIEVAAGEKAVDVDLARWVSDPDGDDPSAMTYSSGLCVRTTSRKPNASGNWSKKVTSGSVARAITSRNFFASEEMSFVVWA